MYTEDLPKYGDLMTVEVYKLRVKTRTFVDYDGCGCPVKNGKMSKQHIYPSQIDSVPEDATHIIWFNR